MNQFFCNICVDNISVVLSGYYVRQSQWFAKRCYTDSESSLEYNEDINEMVLEDDTSPTQDSSMTTPRQKCKAFN